MILLNSLPIINVLGALFSLNINRDRINYRRYLLFTVADTLLFGLFILTIYIFSVRIDVRPMILVIIMYFCLAMSFLKPNIELLSKYLLKILKVIVISTLIVVVCSIVLVNAVYFIRMVQPVDFVYESPIDMLALHIIILFWLLVLGVRYTTSMFIINKYQVNQHNQFSNICKLIMLVMIFILNSMYAVRYNEHDNLFKYMIINKASWWDYSKYPVGSKTHNNAMLNRLSESIYYVEGKAVDESDNATAITLNNYQQPIKHINKIRHNSLYISFIQKAVYEQKEYTVTFRYNYINNIQSQDEDTQSIKVARDDNQLIVLLDHDVDQQKRKIIIDKAYEQVNRNILSTVFSSQVKYDINYLGYFSEILYNPDNQQDRIDYVINKYYYQ